MIVKDDVKIMTSMDEAFTIMDRKILIADNGYSAIE